HRQHFSYDPAVPGIAYGFFEDSSNHQHALSHSGGWHGFVSDLMLLPDHHFGFFLCGNYNTVSFRTEFKKRFLDHYFPEDRRKSPTASSLYNAGRLKRYTGSYINSRFSLGHLEKLIRLSNQCKITADAEGLVFHYPQDRLPSIRLIPEE